MRRDDRTTPPGAAAGGWPEGRRVQGGRRLPGRRRGSRTGSAHAPPLRAASLSRPLYATLLSGQVPLQHRVVSNDHAEVALASSVLDDLREGMAAAAWSPPTTGCAAADGRETSDPWLHRDAACRPGRPVPAGTGKTRIPTTTRWPTPIAAPPARPPTSCWCTPWPGPCLPRAWRRIHGLPSCGPSPGHLADARCRAGMPTGFDVLLTSDHGMNADGWHGGNLPSGARCRCWWPLPRGRRGGVPCPPIHAASVASMRGWLAEELPA